MENSSEDFIPFQQELDLLQNYLALEKTRFADKFDYEITVDENLNQQNLQLPGMMVQPFLENAIWHGIQNKNSKGHIIIQINCDETESLKISITDDGIGRKASALLKKSQTTHISYGLEITIDRLKILNPSNSVTIIDLYDETSQPKGTQVLLNISS